MSMDYQAYQFAASWHGVEVKGKTPIVKYVEKLTFKGKSGDVFGKYRCFRIPIVRWVIWDRIYIVNGLTLWATTCREMSYALDARRGKDRNDSKANAVYQAAADAS